MLDRAQKQQVIDSIKADIEGSQALFLTNMVGISAHGAVSIRKHLREESEGKVVVAKNALLKRAAEGTRAHGLLSNLEGPNALAFAFGDASAVAKCLKKAGDDFDAISIKGGLLNGQELTVEDIFALADLPSREEMLGTVLASIMACLSSFVRLLGAIKEQKEKEQATF